MNHQQCHRLWLPARMSSWTRTPSYRLLLLSHLAEEPSTNPPWGLGVLPRRASHRRRPPSLRHQSLLCALLLSALARTHPPPVWGMKHVVGSPGTWSGMALRLSQCVSAGASMAAMINALGFSNYTAFCYLIASMGLQLLWSFGLACLDIYSLMTKRDLRHPAFVSRLVIGDWVSSILSLAAASGSAGLIVLFDWDVNFCRIYAQMSCGRYELSVILAFIHWAFISTSAVSMFWLLWSL